jgi:predicted Zn-dependent protease
LNGTLTAVKNKFRHSRLVLGLLAASLCFQAAWPQNSVLPSLGDGDGITLAAERKLGDRIARELFRDPDYLEDPILDEYIQRLWSPLIKSAAARGDLSPELQERFAWRILLGRDRSVNAFALPGGYLGVHLGLIAVVSTHDELASVLAHELSHVTQRHIARSMGEQGKMTPWVIGSLILGILAASKSAQGAQALVVGGQAAAIQSQLSYSRDMEREADRVGYSVLTDAGYDPQGFVGMFGKLQQAAGLNDNGAYPYLRSHPLTTERIADMQARLQLNAAATPRPIDAEQAMLSARARVLSQGQVDAWRASTITSQVNLPNATAATRAGIWYGATLAHMQLKDFTAAERNLQNLERVVSGQAAPQRLAKLLRAELAAAQGRWDEVPQGLARQDKSAPLDRPELIATAQALIHLPHSTLRQTVLRQLREQVQTAPLDAQSWNTLAAVLAVDGQALASLRAEGEAQMARMDWQGAIDRFRAAQDWAKSRPLQAGDHIEASIVDTRLRQAQALVREMQNER